MNHIRSRQNKFDTFMIPSHNPSNWLVHYFIITVVAYSWNMFHKHCWNERRYILNKQTIACCTRSWKVFYCIYCDPTSYEGREWPTKNNADRTKRRKNGLNSMMSTAYEWMICMWPSLDHNWRFEKCFSHEIIMSFQWTMSQVQWHTTNAFYGCT